MLPKPIKLSYLEYLFVSILIFAGTSSLTGFLLTHGQWVHQNNLSIGAFEVANSKTDIAAANHHIAASNFSIASTTIVHARSQYLIATGLSFGLAGLIINGRKR